MRALIVAVVAALAMCATVPAGAAGWASFTSATFSGLYISPALPTDPMASWTTSLSLAPGATITIGEDVYPVIWIQAFYVRSADTDQPLSASDGGTNSGWTWRQKPPNEELSYLVGWQGQGSNRLTANQTWEFTFSTIDLSGVSVQTGFHVGYIDDGCDKTGFFTGGGQVPEPSALQVGLTMIAGMAGLALRGLRRGGG